MATILHTFKKITEETKVVPLPHYSQKGCNLFHIAACESITVIHLHNGWYELSHGAPGVNGYDRLRESALNADPCSIERFNEALQIVKESLPQHNSTQSNPSHDS